MKPLDYFLYVLPTDNLLNLDWYNTFLQIMIEKELDNNYLKINNGKYYVKVDGKLEELEGDFINQPIIRLNETIKINNTHLANITNEVETTVGRAIANKTLLVFPFNNKVPYINSKFSIGDVENLIIPLLRSDSISVKEYIQFTNAATFVRGLSKITNVSATYKNVLPPANLDKIKANLIKEFNTKYGPNWKKDRTKVVEYQERLKQVDSEWLKDDPSNGKLVSGKLKDNARVKMYLTFGPEVGFDKDGENIVFVENSLLDGYPNDKEQLSAMFNSSRSGSFDRGHETQKGGVVAKDILRATSSYKIVKGDCGSKQGKKIVVTKDLVKILKGRYAIIANKSQVIDNPEAFIGKEIYIRTPMYCKEKGSKFCSVCVGETLASQPTSLNLSLLNISNTILTASLKSMHNTQVKLHTLNLKSVIY